MRGNLLETLLFRQEFDRLFRIALARFHGTVSCAKILECGVFRHREIFQAVPEIQEYGAVYYRIAGNIRRQTSIPIKQLGKQS